MKSPMQKEGETEGYLDWTILKYGWLIVFLIHGVFLYIGLHWLRQAYHMEHASLYTPEQLRISHLLTSVYMVSIAFSLILVILAVFVLEIFRGVQRMSQDMQDIREALDLAPPRSSGLDLFEPVDEPLDDTIPLAEDAAKLRSEAEAPDDG